MSATVIRYVPYPLNNAAPNLTPMLCESMQRLVMLYRRDFVAVVAHEVKLHLDETERAVRYLLTARAMKRNTIGHQMIFRSCFRSGDMAGADATGKSPDENTRSTIRFDAFRYAGVRHVAGEGAADACSSLGDC